MKKARILAAGLLVMVLAAGLTACGSNNEKQDETTAKTIQSTVDAADGTYKTEVTLKGGSEEESVPGNGDREGWPGYGSGDLEQR